MTLSQFDLIGMPAGNESSNKAGGKQVRHPYTIQRKLDLS